MGIKKVAIISSVPLSEPVSRNRILPFLQLFLEEGIKVTLVCPQSDVSSHAHPVGVKLVEVELEAEKPKSFIRRAIKEARDVSALLKLAKKEQADAYLVTIPSMFLAFLSPLYLPKKQSFIDVRDLAWEYLSDKSFLQRVSKSVFRSLFKRTINFYELVAVTNTTELVYVNKLWKGQHAPLMVSNGITQEQFDKLKATRPANNEKLTVTYIGNIGIAQHLDTLIEAAKQLPNVLFKIVGSGIEHEKIQNLVSAAEISNVEFTGRIPWGSVKDYYNKTNILYAQLTVDFSGAMPSKLYEYLSTGKYIIYGGQGQAAEKLSEFNNNQVIRPNDVAALVNAIEKAAQSTDINQLNQENRQQIKEHYIRENTARKLIKGIKEHIELGSEAVN